MKANDRLNSVVVKTATLFNLSLAFIFRLKLFRGQIYSVLKYTVYFWERFW